MVETNLKKGGNGGLIHLVSNFSVIYSSRVKFFRNLSLHARFVHAFFFHVYPFVCLSVHLSVCFYACLSPVFWYFCLSVCLSVHMYVCSKCLTNLTYFDADILKYALMLIPIRIWQSVLQFRPDTIFSL